MRAYGRVTDIYGNKTWVVVETDANGDSSYVYVTALCQALLLNFAESPFWANFGIPAKNSVLQQQAPDYFVGNIVSYFSQFFASLMVTRRPTTPGNPTPIYDIAAVFKNGVTYQSTIGV